MKLQSLKKLSLKILAVVLFIFLLIAILVPVFVDVNHYKSEISTLVKEQSGLKLEIKGDITLSIITGIKFSVDDISLYNDKKLIMDISHLSLKLTPQSLYSESVTVSKLNIDARELNILFNKKGRSNFIASSSSADKSADNNTTDKTDTAEKGYIKSLMIEDVVLNVKKLNYQDQQNGDSLILNTARAELSLLPVMDNYQLVIDTPSVLVNYQQSGMLEIKDIHLPGRQIQALLLSFENEKGFIETNDFNFTYIENAVQKKLKQAKADSDVRTKKVDPPLTFKAENKLKLELSYPESSAELLNWSKPDRLMIELSVDKMADFKLTAGDYVFEAETLKLNIKRQDLFADGKSKISDLIIEAIELSGDQVKVKTPGDRDYSFTHIETDLIKFPVFKKGQYLKPLSRDFLKQFARQGQFRLKSGKLFGEQVGLENFNMLIEGKQKEIVLSKLTLHALDSELQSRGKIFWAKNNDIHWQLNIASKKLNMEPVSRLLESGNILKGYVFLDNNLSGTITRGEVNILEGNVLVKGDNLQLHGFNLNKVLKDFQNSQSVGMLDVGAVVLLGPAGVLVTKGNDYRNLVKSVANKGNSQIKQLHSEIAFANGIATMKDVAFATDKFRLAITGKIDTIKDQFIDFNVATVDKYGCPVYKEQVMGKLSSPRVKEVNVLVSSVVNPIQSVISKVTKTMNIHCDKPFYAGVVKAPI